MMKTCPSAELIGRYVAGQCDPQQCRSLEAHVAGCRACAESVKLAGRAARSDAVTRKADDAGPVGTPGSAARRRMDSAKRSDAPTMSMPEASAWPGQDGSREGRPEPTVAFEGYEILEELPQGGQAVVYKAIHKSTKAKVALKVLLPAMTASAKARRYFRQEVELAAGLNHPNIVAIRDSGIAQGQYYFAMEYVRGQPLDRHIQSRLLSFRDKITLFLKICDAMAHAHQRGVIHRDLKPSNILVDERGEPHVLDFGLAKTAAGLSDLGESSLMPTITGQIKGTVAYMSPEQAAGRSDLVDVRTDVYTLGVIFYQLLTGQFPYDVSGSAVQTLQNIQETDPVRPKQYVSRFDSDVEAIILKSLAKEPSQRYQSAADLRDDVQRWLDGLPIVAKSVSSIYLLRKIVARHRYTASVVGLLLCIVLSFMFAGAYMLVQLNLAKREADLIAQQWRRESEQNLRVYRHVGFLRFLDAWQDGQIARAKAIAEFLSSGSLERKVADLMLNPAAAAPDDPDKQPSARAVESFALAEIRLKQGYRADARRAYEDSYAAMKQVPEGQVPLFDDLLRIHVEARLYELQTVGAAEADRKGGPADAGS